MTESKGELPDTLRCDLKDDGEIPGKLQEGRIDKDGKEQPRDAVQINKDDAMKADDLSDDNRNECLVCDPCEEDGKHLTAEGFCVDCNDFLCQDCFQNHRKPKPSKHHNLQDKKSMPLTKSTITKERQDERHCLIHQGQVVLSYCATHDSVLCKVCQQFDHRQCQKHGDLIDLNEVAIDTSLLTDVQCQLVALGEVLGNNKTISTQTGNNIKVSYARVVKKITEMKEADLQMTKDINVTCENMLLDVVSMGEDLKSLSAREDKLQLFLKLKKAQTMLKTYDLKLIQVRNDNKNFEYAFLSGDQKNKNFGKFGTLMKCPIERETINIKTETDETDCKITGIARLSGDKYVISDGSNNKVKLIDLTCKTVSVELNLGCSPGDITKINESRIAVTTLDSNAILLIDISETMTMFQRKGSDWDTFGRGRRISNINNQLVVSLSDKLQVYTLDGKLKHSIRFNDKDKVDFVNICNAQNISHRVDTNIIYLTDETSNEIYRITLDGEVLSRFTHECLIKPRGINCCRDGRIFVCSLGSHMIFEISSDLSQGQVILCRESGIFQPYSISFLEERQQLLIGSKGKNILQIFQL